MSSTACRFRSAVRSRSRASATGSCTRWHLPPTKPGAARHLLWLAAWMLLLGEIFHGEARAFLHVSFVGGFALMTLAVGTHSWPNDPERFFNWMGVAAGLFVAAVLVWAAFVVPKSWRV